MHRPDEREQHPERELEIPGRAEDEDIRLMRIIGAFRVVDGRDLPPEADMARLVKQGMVRHKTAYLRRGKDHAHVYVLTPAGQDRLESLQDSGDAQRYWAGLVKPRELEHDLGVYGAYRAAAARIERDGGEIIRVVLDYELKSVINSYMNRASGPPAAERRAQLAAEQELPVIRDRLVLPDARIEYRDAAGQERHLDVDVTTRHYKGQHMARSRQSGFQLVRSSNSPRAAVRDDHHHGWLG